MMRYRLLWIDDKKKDGFIDEADLAGFDIEYFSNSEEGMQYLEAQHGTIDGIILDAKVYKNQTAAEEDDDNLSGMLNSIKIIERLEERFKRVFPKVVYTGQGDLLADDEFEKTYDFIKVLSKADDSDKLFEYLRDQITNTPEAQLKAQYAELYKAATSQYLNNKDTWGRLYLLLSHIQYGTPIDVHLQFTALRRVLERLCGMLSKYGVIPTELTNLIASLQLVSIFVSSKGSEIILEQEKASLFVINNVFPKAVSDQITFVWSITGAGSHEQLTQADEIKRPAIKEYFNHIPNPQILNTLTLMVCDILVWSVNYISQNNDVATNKLNWKLCPWLDKYGTLNTEGRVTNMTKIGTAFLKPNWSNNSNANLFISKKITSQNNITKVGSGYKVKSSLDSKTKRRSIVEILDIL